MARSIAAKSIAFMASFSIGALAALGAALAQSSPTKLDFAGSVTWMGQVPIMVAIDKGYFKDAGLDVEIKVVLNSSDRIAAHGMTIKDVSYLNLPPNEMAGAISKGDVDSACVWEPLLDGVKQAAPGGKLLGTDMDTDFYKKYGTQAAPDIVIISKKLVDEHPDEAQKLAAAIFKGAELTIKDPAEAAATTAHYFKKPADEVLAQVKTFRYFGPSGWPEHIKKHTAHMQALAQWLYDNNKIPSVPDVAKWENVSFLPKP
jgi:ABC-type nitrate/sulfonate/bicarbonate transport system substrate-binding protein